LIGFIGAPWTLVAYSVEGGHSKLCPNIKKMCLQDPAFAHSILEKYTEALCTYASYQVLPAFTFDMELLFIVTDALGARVLSSPRMS
jgi:Uroporphyrinogen decarboxylase (URO-D)